MEHDRALGHRNHFVERRGQENVLRNALVNQWKKFLKPNRR